MSDPFIAEIRMFGGNFAPRGWAFCNGQLISIAQNTALFSLLGTNFGGNGQTNFALPDLQGRAPMHPGNGAGLTPRGSGERGSERNLTLPSTEMPAHSHAISGAVIANSAPTGTPNVASLFTNSSPNSLYANAVGTPVILAPQAISIAGGSQPHNNMQPYLAVSFIIAMQGIFPARN